MKFELIVRRKTDISEAPLDEWNSKWFAYHVEQRVEKDVRWKDAEEKVTSDEGIIFTFTADTVHKAYNQLTTLSGFVDQLGTHKHKWPEYEIRVNGMRVKYFNEGMVVEYDKALRAAIKLLKQGRGRKPSKKESQIRRILEDALPENQRWILGA